MPGKLLATLLVLNILLIGTLITGCTGSKDVTITISAASSLRNSLVELKNIYGQENPHVELVFNFGSSGSLQRQIEQGAPVDLFFSAAEKHIEELNTQGMLLDGSLKNLLENKIVLITPQDSLVIQSFADLTKGNVKTIALGEPSSVPAGKYAQEVLTTFDLWPKVNDKLVYAKDVSQVLAYVETGNALAGIVYYSDALNSTKIRIVATAPPSSHSQVLYPLAVLKSSQNLAQAKSFARFLASEKAAKVFRKNGFLAANKP